MINKLISIAILAFVCAISVSEISAQEKAKEQKVVIIEKEVDENGKVTEKKVVKTGAEAEAYIEEMEKNKGDEAGEGKKVMMVRKEAYEIETEDGEGKVKIMKWDGEGEMPAEMKELIEKEGIDLSDKDGQKKSRVKIKRKGEGEEQVMDFEFEGDELPDEIKEMLEKEGIDIEEVIKGNGIKEIKVKAKSNGKGMGTVEQGVKKAQLGVNIEAHPRGVMVSNVIAESSAAIAGIQAGDIITRVDDVVTKEVMDLVNKISEYKPDDKVVIAWERDGVAMTETLTLKERIDPFPHKTWESVMNSGKKNETIEVEIDQEVIIEKK